jgi:23S rRNA (cytidine1920-2'-O)/16S rRNA (cytidine1409-2'-O)-methyltransferase
VSRKERLDKLVVERGLAPTRSRAQALIMAGQVVVDDRRVDKPGAQVAASAELRLKGEVNPYASRGGLKLAGALRSFAARGAGVPIEGRVAMDVGASTGGFTDCLLQSGVARVYAVDVGYGQLAWKLARDERVIVLDRCNIRALTREQVPEAVDLCVADCSFISLTKVLPCLPPFLAPGADMVALIKPQFEVGPQRVGKGGIVRDAEAREDARRSVCDAATHLGFETRQWCESPIRGQKGNQEFLVWLHWPGD